MKNYYIEKMEQLESKYQGKFKRIIDDLKVGAKETTRFKEDIRKKELNYLLLEAKKQTREIKTDYVEKCQSILKEDMPIPNATKYSELDLRLLKLNMLANENKDNIDKLKDILNEEDFYINKGQLMEIALLKSDDDLLREVTNIKKVDVEFIKGQAQAKVYKIKMNENFIPGADVGTKALINKTYINDYLQNVVNATISENSFSSSNGNIEIPKNEDTGNFFS